MKKNTRYTLSDHKPLHFPTQRPNEHVVLLLRRHWTVLAYDVTQLVLSLVLPPVLFVFGSFYTSIQIVPNSPVYVLIIFAVSLYYLFSFLAYFHDFVDYHLDIWVVTDQRIVSIEQQGLFNRIVSELNILQVQDVTAETRGKVQTFLDFGSVHIQSAGERQRFVFEQVPHPSEVARIILQVHDRAVQRDMVRQSEMEARIERQMASGSGMMGMGGPLPQPQQPRMQSQLPRTDVDQA